MKASEITNYTTWRQYASYVRSVMPKLDPQRRVVIHKMLDNCERIARPFSELEHRFHVEKREIIKSNLERKIKSELLPSVRTLERILLLAKLTQR